MEYSKKKRLPSTPALGEIRHHEFKHDVLLLLKGIFNHFFLNNKSDWFIKYWILMDFNLKMSDKIKMYAFECQPNNAWHYY